MNITFLFVGIIFLTLINGLPVWNLARLGGSTHLLWLFLPVVVALLLMLSVSFINSTESPLLYITMKHIAFYFVIILALSFVATILWTLPSLFFPIPQHILFWGIILSTLVYAGYARINGERIIIEELNFSSELVTRPYHFVQITDVHNGSTNRAHAQKIVDVVKPLAPEFMVITGDFIDEEFVTFNDIEPFNQLDFPIYLITGNHEYYLKEGKINTVLEGSKIQLVDRSKVSWEELDIIGVNELETIDDTVEAVGGIDGEKYTIVLDHQPKTKEAQRAEALGAELMLSGHTHKGQIWPMNLLIRLQFKYITGLYEVGNMNLYVNQGTGTFGPKMRANSVNEVTLIHIEPKGSSL